MGKLTLEGLLALERAGWHALCESAGSDFYGSLMSEDALMVLVNGTVLDRDAVVSSLRDAPAWDNFDIEEPRVVSISDDAAVLVYRATATRGQEPPFRALMSSVYTVSEDEVHLVLYQQTAATP